MSSRNFKYGFTLIELLFVISIITLLSSLLLAATRSSVDKARIAAGQQFASTVRAQLGDNLISWWSFDTLQGNTVIDNWGSNNGTNNNAAPVADVNGKANSALSFSGSTYYIDLGTPSSLSITGPITVEAWIYPKLSGILMRFIRSTDQYDLRVQSNRVYFTSRTSSYGFYTQDLNVLNLNKWNHVVASFGGITGSTINSNNAKIYINGMSKKIVVVGPSWFPSSTITSVRIGGTQFNGYMDEVRIYNSGLTAQEVQKLYAESAPRHGLAIK